MTEPVWHPLDAALDRAAENGRIVDVWLRDDDAVAATPALERLAVLCDCHNLPALLAVIPAGATDTLRRFVEDHPILVPTQHGFAHVNNAASGERARELGGTRTPDAVLDDLAQGRDILGRMFGARVATILVPPWNRIDPAIVALLPTLGYSALSTFGPPGPGPVDLAIINCDLDIIDWRNGRVCRPHATLVQRLAALVDAPIDPGRAIGLLTHHLVHDAAAWTFLERCLERLERHPAVRFTTATALLSHRAAAPHP